MELHLQVSKGSPAGQMTAGHRLGIGDLDLSDVSAGTPFLHCKSNRLLVQGIQTWRYTSDIRATIQARRIRE